MHRDLRAGSHLVEDFPKADIRRELGGDGVAADRRNVPRPISHWRRDLGTEVFRTEPLPKAQRLEAATECDSVHRQMMVVLASP